jgi:hypothetical protein
MIPVQTPKGVFHVWTKRVWTKRVGDNPRIDQRVYCEGIVDFILDVDAGRF